MIQLYTSHWRLPLIKEVDAQIVSISRGEPRWRLPFRYKRLRVLAPSDEAWAQKDRESFTAAYFDQLKELGAAAILKRLAELGGVTSVVCLCWEKPAEFCHRRLLARYIMRETGLVIPELAPGMLPQRPGLQPTLFEDSYREERGT